MNPIVLIVLLLLICGGIGPWFPYSATWGYYPFGGAGLILIIVLILVAMGRI